MTKYCMRLFEFSVNDIQFSVKQYGRSGIRIFVLGNIDVDYAALPELWQKLLSPGQLGLIDLGPAKRGYLEIENVFLVPELRRQGIGRELYNKALELALQQGAKGLYSDPSNRNINSDAFWAKYSQGSVPGVGDILEKPL